MKTCPRCEKELEDEAAFCKYCGKAIASSEQVDGKHFQFFAPQNKTALWIWLFLFAAFGMWEIFFPDCNSVSHIVEVVLPVCGVIYSIVGIAILRNKEKRLL